MKSKREKKGQFVIIAVMLTAIMIVSIGALMHGAITYYRHEPWEEYSTLIGDIEVNSRRVVELSLAAATISNEDVAILRGNLAKWQNNLTGIFPSMGISLTYEAADCQLSKGSNPTAKVPVFTLNIASIGLKGYTFSVEASLNLDIWKTDIMSPYNLAAIVKSENGVLVTGLDKESFKIDGVSPKAVTPFFDDVLNTLVYRIEFEGTPTTAQVTDYRGICAEVTSIPTR
jgi:hypothetical protein